MKDQRHISVLLEDQLLLVKAVCDDRGVVIDVLNRDGMGRLVDVVDAMTVHAFPILERGCLAAEINILSHDAVFVKGEQYVLDFVFIAILVVVMKIDGGEPFTRQRLGNDRIRCRDHGVIDFGNT